MTIVPLQALKKKRRKIIKKIMEKILKRLEALGYSLKVMNHSPVITMDDVVQTLDIPIASMAKTILLSQEEIGLIAIVLPGMNRIDYLKVAKILSVPRKTVKIAELQMLTNLGLNSGEVCPFYEFFQKTIVDTALLTQQFVYCGSGDPRKTIVISPKEMVEATMATMADVSQKKKEDVYEPVEERSMAKAKADS